MLKLRSARAIAALSCLTFLALSPPLGAQQAAPAEAARAESTRYVAGVADLPLMPGLDEMKESALVFDKPGGRIVEAFAAGAVTRGEVMSFYESTLPQLGWRRDRSGGYLREGERLKLTLTEAAGNVTVQFQLSPQ